MSNTIARVEIKDFLVFKGEFTADFCPGVNVFIGGNGSGKTTLLRCLYDLRPKIATAQNRSPANAACARKTLFEREWGKAYLAAGSWPDKPHFVYIPEKDILEHAKGLLTFIEQKQTGFSAIYRDVLIAAQDIPTRKQTALQKSVERKIVEIIGGHIHWDKGDGSFYTLKTNGQRIPFAQEASGFKKLGFLGLLVSSGQIAPGSVLLWDEPENSLNPKLAPVLADILLELQKGGVQIFIATHSYDIARWFELNKLKDNTLRYFNLQTSGGGIIATVADDYVSLPNSVIEDAGDMLLNRVAEVAAKNARLELK